MSENYTSQNPNTDTLSIERPDIEINNIEIQREELSLALVEKHLISQAMYESGALDAFAIYSETQTDCLKHLLIGDENGGAHHLPTLLEVGDGNVTVGSMIQPQESLRRKLTSGELRREQKVKDSGMFKVLDIRIKDKQGKILRKMGGSTMFPSEWSTEKVISSIIDITKIPGETRGDVTRHVGEIDGVKIMAVTSNLTGKILTGFPR